MPKVNKLVSFRTKTGRISIRTPSVNSGVNLSSALLVSCKGREADFRNNSLVINWGVSNPIKTQGVVINSPEAVKLAVNKLSAFKHLKDKLSSLSLLPYATSPEGINWRGRSIARTILSGSSGAGIVPFTAGEEAIPQASLYTQYIKYRTELRFHVFNGEVIYSQIKRRRTTENLEALGLLERSKIIRNLDNGWVYCEISPQDAQNGINIHAGGEIKTIPWGRVAQAAIEAVVGLGLDFGAVDLIYSWKQDKIFLLEVNTAPGLADNAFLAYQDTFNQVINQFK